MNDLSSPRLHVPGDELDTMLRDFFRAEMPSPWPAMKAPASPRQQMSPARPWWRNTGRLALAASIGFVLLGYLALAGFFPKPGALVPNGPGNTIGKGLPTPRTQQQPRRLPTRSGGEALLWEEQVPGNLTRIQVQEIKSPTRRP